MPHSEFLDFALTQVLRIIQQTNDRLVHVMVIAQNTRGCRSEIEATALSRRARQAPLARSGLIQGESLIFVLLGL